MSTGKALCILRLLESYAHCAVTPVVHVIPVVMMCCGMQYLHLSRGQTEKSLWPNTTRPNCRASLPVCLSRQLVGSKMAACRWTPPWTRGTSWINRKPEVFASTTYRSVCRWKISAKRSNRVRVMGLIRVTCWTLLWHRDAMLNVCGKKCKPSLYHCISLVFTARRHAVARASATFMSL